MADRITDELLRFTATSSFRLHDDEVRAIAAELLAARARITKLEQEPPMAMIDFGVGVNWKGLSEERKRLRAELDAARADFAAVACVLPPCCGSLADAAQEVVDERDAARAEVERLRNHIDSAGTGFNVALGAIRLSLEQADKDRDALRAEVERLRAQLHADDHRAWEALGRPEGTYDTTNVQRLCAEVERLNGLLPLLMQLWDAAKEAAGTISMSQEHSCYHTYGFLDKEPALKMVDALEELRLWKNKETP